MLKKRIIPALDIKGGRVVKSVNFFENLRDIGDPAEVAMRYEAQGAKELVFLDITATLEGRDTMYELVKKTVKSVKIPLTVGGGVRTVEDCRKLFDCGAARVFVNSGAVTNPSLIRDAAAEFGSEKIVAAIDGKPVDGEYMLFINGGYKNTGINLIEWCKTCERDGAGEILLTSMDGDGTQNGYDIPMLKAVVENVKIPVVASGGAGEVSHIVDAFKQTDCDAALVASLMHFGKATIGQIREELERNGYTC
jgi:cyclase